jgi:hypothetical protein
MVRTANSPNRGSAAEQRERRRMGDFEDIYAESTGGDVGDFLGGEEKPATSGSTAKEDDIFGAVGGAEDAGGGEATDDDDDDDDGVDISFAEVPGGSSAPSQVPHA